MTFTQNPEHPNQYTDDDTGKIFIAAEGQSIDELLAELRDQKQNPVPLPMVDVIPAVTLWERLTEAEAEQVNAVMATQPFRTRQIFLTANTFRSDHELWPLLQQMAIDLFGEVRASELLAA